MKKIVFLVCVITAFFSGCTTKAPAEVIATTKPVYEFTSRLCDGTDITVSQLITENVSCLHDYTLKAEQMKAVESAQLVMINGLGLEDFLEDVLDASNLVIDSSEGLQHIQHHGHNNDHSHAHEEDAHIWLSPANAKQMVSNIYTALCEQYPNYSNTLTQNLTQLYAQLDTLEAYGHEKLSTLSCRDLITFHDGFYYFAESFDLEVLYAIEEESGSEASAQELIALISLVNEQSIPAIFIETNGSASAASIISNETGAKIYKLDMGMSEKGYFESMYYNINTIWEALQ